MNDNRTKNSIRNIVMGLLYRTANILLPFVIKSILINALGVEYLGLNSLFSSILNILNLTEFGFASAITYKMYEPAANNDTEKLSELLSVYKKIYKVIGIIILIVGIILLPFIPNLISGTYPAEINLNSIYLVYLCNSVLSYLLFAYKGALFSAYQRLDIQSIISALIMFGMNACQIVILLLFRDYNMYLILMPMFTVANNLIVAYVTKKKFPQVTTKKIENKAVYRDIFGKAGAMFGHKLNYVIVTSANSIIISSFLGLTVLAQYSNYYTVLNVVIGFIDTITQAVLPSIGNLLVEGNQKKTNRIFEVLSFAQYWGVGWCCVCLVCLYQPFMRLWMGDAMMLDMYVVILFALYLFSYKARTIVLLFKDAAGMWNEDLFKPYVSAVCNIVLNVSLVRISGIYGVLISTIIAFAVISFPWESMIVVRKILKSSAKKFYSSSLTYLLQALAITFVTFKLCERVTGEEGIIDFIVRVLICVFIPNVLYFVFNFKTDNFKYLLSILKK